jgi:hypothetical protein
MNLTDWFPGSAKPVRKGVYQREYTYGKSKGLQYCYWNGKEWGLGNFTVENAMLNAMLDGKAFLPAPRQRLPWRGVLK